MLGFKTYIKRFNRNTKLITLSAICLLALLFHFHLSQAATDIPVITDFTAVTDSGCAGCSVSFDNMTNTLTSTIAGGADTKDTAYGLKDFGGTSGWNGLVYTRTNLGFPGGQPNITQNLAVFQEWDVNKKLIYELFVRGSDRQLCMYSPIGSLGPYELPCSGVVVPTGSTIRVEVAAQANNSFTLRVNDVNKITLTGLTGSTVGSPRYLLAGIDHYDATTTSEIVKVAHGNVGITTAGWLGTRITSNTPQPPVNTVTPSISGAVQDGQPLAVSNGTWSGSTPMTFAYQWQKCDTAGVNCADISGAASNSYIPANADQGSTLRARVTATNSAASATANSATTSVVKALPINTSPPIISGTYQDGKTLSVSSGAWTGTPAPSYIYQWRTCDAQGSNCVNISGATTSSYTLNASQIGQKVSATVTASNSVGTASVSATSAVISAALPQNNQAPAISGVAQENKSLTANNGSWNGTQPITYNYQWMNCNSDGSNCNNINGATNQNYTIQNSDVGKVLCVIVTANNAAGSVMAMSADTSAVTPAPTPPANAQTPAITGQTQDGQQLQATNGNWSGTQPITYSYQWQRCDSTALNCTDITNATNTTYDLSSSDIGLQIRVKVNATNTAGTSSAYANATSVIAGVSPTNNSRPVITGIVQVRQRLTVSSGSWAGSQPLSFTYKWQRCGVATCTDIVGITSATYVLTTNDSGYNIKAIITATNVAGSSSAESQLTTGVAIYSPSLPHSIAALGDSLTRGYGSDGSVGDVPSNSWATGGNPAVYSEYLRVLARDGGVSGHLGNYAQSGSNMAATLAQSDSAISQNAEFVTIWSGTNDVCRPDVSQMTAVADYQSQFNSTLSKLSSALPNAQILVASIPNWYAFWQAFQSDPNAQNAWNLYNDRCNDLFGPQASDADRLAISQSIQNLNNILSQTCANFSNCVYDNGAVYNLSFQPGDLTYDYFHLSVSGQAKIAAALWQAGPYSNDMHPALASAPVNTSPSAITGGMIQGSVLSLTTGSWDSNAPVTFSYNWQNCNSGQCIPIAGANQSIYMLTAADIGTYIQASVIATNAFGSSSNNLIALDPVTGLPPISTTAPTISGATQVSSVLSATMGSWTGTQPINLTYQWSRCDNQALNCSPVDGTGNAYQITAGDAGSTIKVTVTAINFYGIAAASSAATAVIYDPNATDFPLISIFQETKDTGCAGCSAIYSAGTNTETATIAGGADNLDTAYGLNDFGGNSGWSGRTYTRTNIGFAAGQTPISQNLAVFHVRDTTDNLMYELYVNGGNKTLCLWSPAGGLNSASINQCSDVVVPTGSTVRAEVSALANSSVTVRINGVDKINVTGLTGAPNHSARYIRAGIDHYDNNTTNEPVVFLNTTVGITTLDWLGTRSGPVTSPPVNQAAPVLSGSAQVGQTLTSGNGAWSGTQPMTFSYIWQRCDSNNQNCSTIPSANAAGYTLVGADSGMTLRSLVTVSNNYGQSSAYSLPSSVVSATAPQNSVRPLITGATKVAGSLYVSPGIWNGAGPIDYSYQWQRCDTNGNNCIDTPGITGTTYLLSVNDLNYTFRVKVTATNFVGSSMVVSNQSAWITDASIPSYNFSQNIVDATGGQCINCATESMGKGDINNDGKTDLVVSGRSMLLWYENANTSAAGSNSWISHNISNSWYGAGAATTVVDINHDGRLDIAVGEQTPIAYQEDWFENTPSGWVKHIASTTYYCHDLQFGELDGPGTFVSICADEIHGKVVLLRPGADPNANWSGQIIDNRPTMGISTADIDRDGKIDVVSGRAWYKNPGSQVGSWTRYPYTNLTTIYTGQTDYEKTSLLDLNGDGRLDIVATLFAESPVGEVWAFLAPTDPTTQAWTAVPIDRSGLFGVHSQVAASFDGTNTPQVMIGETNFGGWSYGINTDPQIYIYRLLGPADNSASWQRTVIDSVGTHEAVVADFNGDGKPDIAGHDENTDFINPPQNGSVHWWTNYTF
jgi:lysophospholipase L1-like esterase